MSTSKDLPIPKTPEELEAYRQKRVWAWKYITKWEPGFANLIKALEAATSDRVRLVKFQNRSRRVWPPE